MTKYIDVNKAIDAIEFYRTNPQHYSPDALIEDINKLATQSEEIAVDTKAGAIRAYKNTDPGQPGIVVMFQPRGFEEEIDASFVSVYEDPGYKTSDNEGPEDLVIMSYGDTYSEDYTQKEILRRENVVKALKN